jgi:hypothetical protein
MGPLRANTSRRAYLASTASPIWPTYEGEREMRRTAVVTCITIAFAGCGLAHAADAQGQNTRPSMALPALTFAIC